MDSVNANKPDHKHESVIAPQFLVSDEGNGRVKNEHDAPDFRAILESAGAPTERIGRVVSAYGTTLHVSGLIAHIGQRCLISTMGRSQTVLADVVGISDQQVILYPLGSLYGLSNKSEVRVQNLERSVPFSELMMGSILSGSGAFLYKPNAHMPTINAPIIRAAPDPLKRRPIEKVFSTGIRAVDTLLTVGEGQRVGIFASAGGGKSTLLSMLARFSDADVVVIGLIGERGREVREFIDNHLGKDGLARSVIVVTTSDRPAIERVNAAHCATTIAEGFRSTGKRVLLLMDSLTRYARALREIGLSVGEPPVRQGFPPSVFSELPQLLERSGNDEFGSITAFYTVLEDDEESSDPISEEVRSILDGHIVLARSMGEQGIYPPIDVLQSASRLIGQVASQEHLNCATRVRQLIAKYNEIELLIQVGEYESGNDPDADMAISCRSKIRELMSQSPDQHARFSESLAQLMAIV